MTWNYQPWEEKQSQAWTGHGRMQEVRPQQTYRELLDFAGCRVFPIRQTNTFFQCRLAVELLLLLKLPPKYHTFHKTCAAASFQPLCPRSGHPQTECSIFSDSSALEKSLFLSIHEPSVVAQSIPLWDRGWGRSCHSLGTEVAQRCSQETGAAAAWEQQLVCKRAKWGKLLTQLMLWGGKKEETTPAIHFILPSSTLPSGKHPCLRLNSWDWRVISHTDQEEHFWFLNITHDSFAFWSDWFCAPSPSEAAWTQLSVWLFCLAKMRARKEKGVSCFLSSTFKVSQPDYHFSSSEKKTRIHCFFFSTGTIQLIFSMSQNITNEHQHSELTKGQGRASKIHYLQEMGGSFYKFCAR